ncbi:MAG: hypothetical protein RIF46_02960, partial [Cyclobacteriaceae bacterium]
YLNEGSKVFVNGLFFHELLTLDLKSSKGEFSFRDDVRTSSGGNLAIGIGYKQNDKYSLELRYEETRQILAEPNFASKYQNISFIAGYSIF